MSTLKSLCTPEISGSSILIGLRSRNIHAHVHVHAHVHAGELPQRPVLFPCREKRVKQMFFLIPFLITHRCKDGKEA